MIKFFITFLILLFIVFNYSNIVSYYFLYSWNYEKSLIIHKSDINYYNMWVLSYHNKDYIKSLDYFIRISKKDYKVYYNLWNTYYFNSFNYELIDEIISNLEKSVFNFSKAMELDSDKNIIFNYNIALKELNKYKIEHISNTEQVEFWNWDNIWVDDINWLNYKLDIDDEVKDLDSKQREEFNKYIKNLN